ncbi:MAG: hypothetical protein ACR2OZ_00895 [Verrucomicrobiales bacterium]
MRILLAPFVAVILGGAAIAGTAETASKNPPPEPPPESPLFTGSVSLGYDTTYVYRGYEVLAANGDDADHLFWGALDLNYAISDKLTWNFNAWYASSGSANYDELDLYTKFSYNVGPFAIGPSFRWYHYPHYPSAIDNQYEVGLELSAAPVENLSLNFGAFYEFEAEQWYLQADASYTIKINEVFSLVPGATVSFIDVSSADFGLNESDFHHVTAYLKAPIKLSSTVTLTPYVAGNFPVGDQVSDLQDPIVYGGAVLAVSF